MSLMDAYKLKPKLFEAQVKTAWPNLMGKTIAGYTSEVRLHKGILYLRITSAPLRNELSYAKEKIKKILNEELGEEYITEVRIG